ncbi:MAG: HAMP domain-containing sensor histidine kinase [Bacteroidota bacterium]
MKKQWIWIGLISIGLLGFAIIQMRLLWIGVRLELKQFEQKVEQAMRKVQDDIFDEPTLEESLAYWIVNSPYPNQGISKDSLIEELERLLKYRLEENLIAADFQFAVADDLAMATRIESANFEETSFRFDEFNVYLGNKIQQKSSCECYLYLHINHLFSYLLSQLNYLLIPMLFFFLALLTGVAFLIQNARKLQKLDAIKNYFINNLTHELKTPVFSIRLASNLIEQQPKEAKKYATLIRKENQKLQHHIDKVLELASLETGKYQLNKEQIDVQILIREVIESFRLKLEERDGKVELVLQPKSLLLTIDRLHFANVIQALMDNAIKYNSSSPKIKINSQLIDNQYILAMKDNGIGIQKDQQKLIFKKFHRVFSGDQHEVKGFGLGLNYVQQVIQLHGGKINVESREGEGTTFTIRLKVK